MAQVKRFEHMLDLIGEREETSATRSGDGVTRILRAIRAHLGMDVAFVSEVTDNEVVIRHADMVSESPVAVGNSFDSETSYCKRIIDGRLPPLIPDTSVVPIAAALAATRGTPVGAHLSVPIRLGDGSVYGTFCCFSFAPDPSLNNRDLEMLRAFAQLAADEIETLREEERRETDVAERIRQVIERDALMMVFQPIYDVAAGRVVGVESLARFPDCATRPPRDWFEEAHSVGLGGELEVAAVRASLQALPFLPDDTYLAINISPSIVLDERFQALIEGVPAGRLVIEITEHAAVADYHQLSRALAPLRCRCRVAVDDVGAGYSGLRHILDLAPDIIKLDMSLTRDIDRDRSRRTLARALVAFATGMGSTIVSEGVETAEELQALRDLGITCAQGYYLSRPLPLMALHNFLIGERGPGPDGGPMAPWSLRGGRSPAS